MVRFERDEDGNACISISCCCGATWQSSLILFLCAVLACFETHLKYLSRCVRDFVPGPFTHGLVALVVRCNFQLRWGRVLGFVLWHPRSAAAADCLKCRQGVCLYLFFQLSVSLVSLASAIDPGESHETSERRKIWKMGGKASLSMACSRNYWTTGTFLLYMEDCQVALLKSGTFL